MYYTHQLFRRVKFKAENNSKTIPQRWSEQPCPGRSSNQREPWQIHLHRPGTRPLSNNKIKLIVLHCGIENFLDHMIKTMNLIDKKDISLLQTGKYRRKIPLFFNDRPRGDLNAGTHLICYDIGKCRFAKTWKTVEEYMIQGFSPAYCCLYKNPQTLPQSLLTDIVIKPFRPDPAITCRLTNYGLRTHQTTVGSNIFFNVHTSALNASRMRSSTPNSAKLSWPRRFLTETNDSLATGSE